MTLLFRRVKPNPWNSAWRWIPGVIAATTTLVCVEVGIFQSFQALTYNILFRIRGPIPWDERIVVVEIDDLSVQAIGQFPIARHYYAQFLERLNEAQPSVVAFDIVFAEASADDMIFAEAMDRLNRVVLAQSWDNQGQPILPNPELTEHAINIGHALNPSTDDGVSRSIYPYIQNVPALGIAIAQSHSLIAEAIAIPDNSPTEPQRFWINWPGPSQTCPSYSFIDVLEGAIPSESFRDKIVIVGVTASGNSPLFTPFNRTPPTGGVYLQAAVVSNLLQQNQLQRTGAVLKVLILVLGGPALSVLSSYRGCRRRWSSWLGFCIGWNFLSLLFLKLSVLLPLFWPLVLVTMTTGLTETVERFRANRHLQREIERLWNAYNSDLALWKRPSVVLPNPHPEGAITEGQESDAILGTMTAIAHPSIQPIAVQRAMQLAQIAELFGRSQSLHAAIARSLSIGLVAADWDGKVWLCNPFAEALMDLQIGEVLTNRLVPSWVTLDHWNKYISRLNESSSPCWEVHQGEMWFEFRLEPLFYSYSRENSYTNRLTYSNRQSSHPKPTGLLLIVQNITTFKQVESEIRNALAEALELSELKTRFVSMASHELRTPLTIMRTSVDLLKVHGLSISPEKHTKYLNRLEESVSSMLKLIDNVLTLGQSDTRRLELKPQPLSIEAFCRDLVAQLQSNELTEKRIHFTSSLDRQHFLFDSELLSLILNNLLSNALKYSPSGTPVDLSIVSSNDGLTFEICDRGIGMPLNYQTHLFKEFARAENVGNIPGNGLGLSIVKRCVDLHGGIIRIESQVGSGTTFQIHFPKSVVG